MFQVMLNIVYILILIIILIILIPLLVAEPRHGNNVQIG